MATQYGTISGYVMSVRRRASHQPIAGKPTKGDMDRFITVCIGQGYTVRHHTHLKTREKWIKKG